jgi:hypothetical protein
MPAPVAPTLIAELGVPPSINDPVNFDDRADQHVQAVVNMVPQQNAANINTYNNALIAYQAASDAATLLASTTAQAVIAGASTSSAQSAAMAAQVAAGLPTLPNAGQLLKTAGAGAPITASTVLAVNTAYDMDTSAGPFSAPLPAVAVIGDWVEVSDWAGSFASNNFTALRNGLKIHFQAADFVADINNLTVRFVYTGNVKGWAVK